MAENLGFSKILDEMEALHERKNADYATDDNEFSNFEFAAQFAGVTVDQVFAVMIGIKQARVLQLTEGGKGPNCEPLRDSYLDGAVYPAMRLGYYDKTHEPPPAETKFADTLTNIDTLVKQGAAWPHLSATLNPHRHIVDVDTFPPPNPAIDAADFRTEGD